jgi:hypothetical protein
MPDDKSIVAKAAIKNMMKLTTRRQCRRLFARIFDLIETKKVLQSFMFRSLYVDFKLRKTFLGEI